MATSSANSTGKLTPTAQVFLEAFHSLPKKEQTAVLEGLKAQEIESDMATDTEIVRKRRTESSISLTEYIKSHQEK